MFWWRHLLNFVVEEEVVEFFLIDDFMSEDSSEVVSPVAIGSGLSHDGHHAILVR